MTTHDLVRHAIEQGLLSVRQMSAEDQKYVRKYMNGYNGAERVEEERKRLRRLNKKGKEI